MFCIHCGQKLPDNARFCAQCGTPVTVPEPTKTEPVQPELAQPEPPKNEPVQQEAPQPAPEPVSAGPDGVDAVLKEMNLGKKSGKLAGFLIGIVVAAVVFAVVVALKVGLPGGGVDTVEGPGFDSPEEAVEAYLEAMKEGDLKGMLETVAMETYVENMDLEAYMERLGGYIPNTMPVPGDSTLIQTINLEKRRAAFTQSLQFQYLMLVDPDSPIREMEPITVEEGERASFLAQVEISGDLETLATLEVGKFWRPETFSDAYADDVNQTNLEKQTRAYGADEICSLAVEVTVDGREYLFCPDAVRYDDTWYLLNLQGNLANLLGISTYAAGTVPVDEFF